jgi:curved DNA-binding protein CbpA
LGLFRLVHPDKCTHPQAKDAAAVVNQAYDTLSSAVKKALYDR